MWVWFAKLLDAKLEANWVQVGANIGESAFPKHIENKRKKQTQWTKIMQVSASERSYGWVGSLESINQATQD